MGILPTKVEGRGTTKGDRRGTYCLPKQRGGARRHAYPTKVERSGHIAYQVGGEGDLSPKWTEGGLPKSSRGGPIPYEGAGEGDVLPTKLEGRGAY